MVDCNAFGLWGWKNFFVVFNCTQIDASSRGLDLRVSTLARCKVSGLFRRGMANTGGSQPRLRRVVGLLHRKSSIIVCGLSQVSQSAGRLVRLSRLFRRLDIGFVSVRSGMSASASVKEFFFQIVTDLTRLRQSVVVRQAGSNLGTTEIQKGGKNHPDGNGLSVSLTLGVCSDGRCSVHRVLSTSGLDGAAFCHCLGGEGTWSVTVGEVLAASRHRRLLSMSRLSRRSFGTCFDFSSCSLRIVGRRHKGIGGLKFTVRLYLTQCPKYSLDG